MGSGVNIEAMAGGVRFGDFMVGSAGGSVTLLSPDGRVLVYQTLFFPAAAMPTQASVLTLKSGEEKTDINFQLRLIPTVRISGVAMGPGGPVGTVGIKLVVPGDGQVSDSEFDVASAVTKKDGTFAFYGVPPGQFLLRAQKQPAPDIPAEAMALNPQMAQMFGGMTQTGPKEALFAATTVSVGSSDLDNLVVQLSPGFRVSGKLEFASATGKPAPPPGQLTGVSVSLTPADGRMPLPPNLMGQTDRANNQGEFKTKGYPPGKYFVSVGNVGGWFVSTITAGGRDALDVPLEIRDVDVSGLVVTYTDTLGAVAGTVRAAGETDLSETVVFLFPQDYRTWAQNGMNPRRGLTARANRGGAYRLANVPAGDYFIVAVDRVSAGSLQDPAYLDAISRGATRVTVRLDEVTQDLNKTAVAR
jgi:hypothetical protein